MANKLNGYEPHPVDYKDKKLEEKRTVKGSTKPKTSPNQKGCPGNDNKEHVYSHVLHVYTFEDKTREEQNYHRWGNCIGCGKKPNTWHKKKPEGEPDEVKRFHYRKSVWERPIKKES